MKTETIIKAFTRCPAVTGYHCITSSLSKLYYYFGYSLSEEMLFGLGAGLGFVYWHTKQNGESDFGGDVFVGGRGNNKQFIQDIAERTCVVLSEKTTSSAQKAENALIEKLQKEQPVIVCGDMAYLPWFNFPEEYHFGGHAFFICGWDQDETVLISDMNQQVNQGKEGKYATMTLSQLQKARNSPYKPFPPKNYYIDPDFSDYYPPTDDDLFNAILQNAKAMLFPPIINLGVKGIHHAASQILLWPKMFTNEKLIRQLFDLYIYTEIGGTGGGSFRYMYSRFLQKAGTLTANPVIVSASEQIHQSGELFTRMALLFENIFQEPDNIDDKIHTASNYFKQIADIEENAFHQLLQEVQ